MRDFSTGGIAIIAKTAKIARIEKPVDGGGPKAKS
jgi:hypothetical protein